MKKKRPSKPITSVERVWDIQDYLKAKNERHYILFMVGVTTGYRAGDLVKLQVRNIREAIERKEFVIYESKKMNSKNIREKNRKPRRVELLPGVAKILNDYIKGKPEFDYVFKSRKGLNKNIGVKAASNILHEAGIYFGLEQISAHSMRKTYAYKIYNDNDKDILVVKELLGHSSIEETKLYLGLDQEKYHQYSKTLNDFVR
jgi:integrase